MSIVRKIIREARVAVTKACSKTSAKMDDPLYKITIKDVVFFNMDDAVKYEITKLGRLRTVVDLRDCVIVPKDLFSEMTGGRYD